MKFFRLTRKFRRDEDGAVTVDWVVLTAAVVGLGAAALLMIRESTKTAAGNIGDYLEKTTVTTGSTSSPDEGTPPDGEPE